VKDEQSTRHKNEKRNIYDHTTITIPFDAIYNAVYFVFPHPCGIMGMESTARSLLEEGIELAISIAFDTLD
jgi:hypothetical protein